MPLRIFQDFQLSFKYTYAITHGRLQDFFRGWAMWGIKDGSPPSGVQGQKLKTFSQNNA